MNPQSFYYLEKMELETQCEDFSELRLPQISCTPPKQKVPRKSADCQMACCYIKSC